MMNLLGNNVVFVPACLLCPSLMATSKKKDTAWRRSVISYLNDNDYSIIQLPCPEASFKNEDTGINRAPHGIQFYENLPGFKSHCLKLSHDVISQIEDFISHGYNVLAIVGIEHSPTCATEYMYTCQGTIKRKGLFFETLFSELCHRNLAIPLLGINRRYPQKVIQALMKLEQGMNCIG